MNLNLIAPINQWGYGIVGVNFLATAMGLGHNVSLWNIGGDQVEALPKFHKSIQKAVNNAYFFDNAAPCLRIWHQFDMAHMVGKGPHCGMPIFELNRFKHIENHHLRTLDKIFVNSEWAKEVVKNNNITGEIYVAPLGVDRSIFSDEIEIDESQNDLAKDDSTKFLTVGKWELRKGHDVIIEAFNRAFKKDDKVVLVVNCLNPFIGKEGNDEWVNIYKNSPLGDKVFFFQRRLESQRHVAYLMGAVDCGVFPARAEGWNLELLEMMSMGKHVIATNYSGHTQFANDKNAHLVSVNELEDAHDGTPFFQATKEVWGTIPPGQWAALGDDQIDEVASYMKKIHELKQNGKLTKNIEGIETAKRFSWENTVERVMHGLQK